jgi:hypothetical protein
MIALFAGSTLIACAAARVCRHPNTHVLMVGSSLVAYAAGGKGIHTSPLARDVYALEHRIGVFG